MTSYRYTIVLLGALLGAWLSIDGIRALAFGDYFTPRSGSHAGQLGPWAQVVSACGVDPRSVFVKAVHVVLGLLWLGAVVSFATGRPWAWWCVLGCSIASVWYLPIGTLIGLVQVAILVLPALPRGARGS